MCDQRREAISASHAPHLCQAEEKMGGAQSCSFLPSPKPSRRDGPSAVSDPQMCFVRSSLGGHQVTPTARNEDIPHFGGALLTGIFFLQKCSTCVKHKMVATT